MRFPKKNKKKKIRLFDIILIFAIIALIANFAPQFFNDKKNEFVSMSATSEMRQNIRNAMNFAIKVQDADFGDPKKAFIGASGLEIEPWWLQCVSVELVSGKPSFISVKKITPPKEQKERCEALYNEPQIQRWLKGNLYITNETIEQMDENATK